MFGCEEIEVFDACIEWAKTACRKNQLNENDSKNLKNHLGDCIYLIQFGKMTHGEVGRILGNKLYADMFNRDELLEITSTSLVPNFEPKLFGKSTRKNLSFSSNKNPELAVRRNINHYNNRNFKNKETTRFTSNIPLLLGKIDFGVNLKSQDFDFDIVHCDSNKTLYNGRANTILNSANSSTLQANLGKGTFIKPQELYEIRLSISPDMVGYQFHVPISRDDVVKIGADIIIKFHENSTDLIVSSMFFKRV